MMDVSKCIFCEHHDVNAKTTFCKLNNESTCTNNDIPCPLELESESIDEEEEKMEPTSNPPISRIYMNSWSEIDDFVNMIRPVCYKVSMDPLHPDHIQLTIKPIRETSLRRVKLVRRDSKVCNNSANLPHSQM